MHLYTADSNFCLVVVWDFSSCAKYKMISCGKPKGTNKRKTETKHWGGYFIPSQVWMQLGWFIIRCVCVCVSLCASFWVIYWNRDWPRYTHQRIIIPTFLSSFFANSPPKVNDRWQWCGQHGMVSRASEIGGVNNTPKADALEICDVEKRSSKSICPIHIVLTAIWLGFTTHSYRIS